MRKSVLSERCSSFTTWRSCCEIFRRNKRRCTIYAARRDSMIRLSRWSVTIINHYSVGRVYAILTPLVLPTIVSSTPMHGSEKRAQQGFRTFFLEGKACERRDRFSMFLPITKNLRDVWELRIKVKVIRPFHVKEWNLLQSLMRETNWWIIPSNLGNWNDRNKRKIFVNFYFN